MFVYNCNGTAYSVRWHRVATTLVTGLFTFGDYENQMFTQLYYSKLQKGITTRNLSTVNRVFSSQQGREESNTMKIKKQYGVTEPYRGGMFCQ